MMSKNTSYVVMLFLGFALLGSTGCASLDIMAGSTVGTESQLAQPGDVYQLEMSGGFQNSKSIVGRVDETTTVESVLESSGAKKKFRDMDIMIYRIVADSGQGLKMEIRYKPGKKMVPPEQNYAILPNDRIVIQEKSNNVMDKVVKTLSSGIGTSGR